MAYKLPPPQERWDEAHRTSPVSDRCTGILPNLERCEQYSPIYYDVYIIGGVRLTALRGKCLKHGVFEVV